MAEKLRDLRSECQGHMHILFRQVNVGLDGHEIVAQSDMLLRFTEHDLLTCRQFRYMLIDVACTHFADTLYSRDIVRGVSADGKHLDNLRRAADAVFFADRLHVHYLILTACLSRLDLENVIVDELAVILVRRYHIYLKACGSLFLRH